MADEQNAFLDGRLKTLTGQSPQDFMRLIRLEQAAIFLEIWAVCWMYS